MGIRYTDSWFSTLWIFFAGMVIWGTTLLSLYSFG